MIGLRLSRIAAMAAKELRVVLLDRRVLTTLIFSPIIQLILFGFATTLEARNIDIGIVNRDVGIASERFLATLAGSRNVRAVVSFPSEAALREAIEHRAVLAGVLIPPDLSRKVARDETAEIGVLLDGRRINAAQIISGYLAEMARAAGAELKPHRIQPVPDVVPTHWFNPNLDYRWFTLPGMIAVIVTVLVLSVSVQAIAREREFGTFDQLTVMPLHAGEIILGKAVPAFCIGVINTAFFAVTIPLFADVPQVGSIGLLILAAACFSLAVTGIGLSISALAQNQQQAFLGGFLVIVPMILLSGYASPVDDMPQGLQLLSAIDPLSHLLEVSLGIFLKDMPAAIVWNHLWPMLLVGVTTLSIATILLKIRNG